MSTPEELEREARELRERAEEIADDNPSASDYHARRAEWLETLARREREEQGPIGSHD